MFEEANAELEEIDPFCRHLPEVLLACVAIYHGLKKMGPAHFGREETGGLESAGAGPFRLAGRIQRAVSGVPPAPVGRGCNGSLARQLLIDTTVIFRFLWLAAIPAILVAPAVAEAQSSFLTGAGGNVGSKRGDSAYQRMLDEPSLTDQEAQQKREEAAAKVQRDAADRDLQEYYRQQKLDQMNQAKATQGGTRNAIPRRANSVAQATERARLQPVVRQTEVARQANGARQAPSDAFLGRQARFERKSPAFTDTTQIDTNANATKIQNEAATANQQPLSAQQQELPRRELAEGQRSGRTPDQLTSAEIVAALTRCY